jgi:NAD(P)-dependent dehydrogenase (short-subunit alcohol dehydrogenase family)
MAIKNLLRKLIKDTAGKIPRRIEGRTAVITGAGSGIGKATAMLFSSNGAKITIADKDEKKGKQAEIEIRSKGGDATFFKTDVASMPSVASLMQNSELTYGPASILVHCAGINMCGGVLSLSEKEWDLTIQTNLTSTFYLTKEVMPQMRKISYGSIVLMSSVQGLSGFMQSSAYAASKGGVISLTRQLARDFAGDKIRVNCISPGVIKTEIFDHVKNRDNMFAAVSDYTPLGHVGDPIDVAYACLYLASDESSYITGVNLAVDGGMTMRSV